MAERGRQVIGYMVFCDICGHGWDERDPGVMFLYGDHAWVCYDEVPCFERRAALAEVGGDG